MKALTLRQRVHTLLWTYRHLRGRYAPAEVAVLCRYLRPNDVCIDVGAHAGGWSLALARQVPHGRVYAFEALPYYARVLAAVLRVLRRENVRLVPQAVLDSPRTVNIAWQDVSGRRLAGYTHIDPDGADGSIAVEGTTLDAFAAEHGIDQRVRFVKLDIEGAELLALRGGRGLLERFRPLVFTELKAEYCRRYGYDPAEVFGFFENLNYHPLLSLEGDPPKPCTSAAFMASGQNDLWFVPKELAGTTG